MYVYTYIYIYIYCLVVVSLVVSMTSGSPECRRGPSSRGRSASIGPRKGTNGVNTNGAAAKGMNFDRVGKKVRPGTLGKINVG